ncbi:MAG: S-methyl-5-thioribose kinase [Parvibaculaceae bacterium]
MAGRYRALADGTLQPFLADVPAAREKLGGRPESWTVREVGDGNLNLVFIVTGKDGAVVVKQALPYVRLVGESWPLPLERSHYEYLALSEQTKHAPHLVPKIFGYDRDMALIVMEYLSPHVIMRKGLIRGIEYPRFATDIAEFMAQTLFNASPLASTAAQHKARIADFAGNTELCRITEDLVFTDPYRIAELNRWTKPFLDETAAQFRADAPLKRAVQELKWKFLTSAEAMIHGDLHTGSIMLTTEDTRVIDPEFAFVGPMGFDVGAVIGNLLLAWFAQGGHEDAPHARDPYRAWILRQVDDIWTGFHDRFLALWRSNGTGDVYVAGLFEDGPSAGTLREAQAAFMSRLFADTLGFAGAKMIRRILGLAHVEDLESIKDPARRAACEKPALALARELILGAKGYSGIAEVTRAARSIPI